MGGGASHALANVLTKGDIDELQTAGISTNDMQTIVNVFMKIDIAKEKKLLMKDIYSFCGLDESKFCERVFLLVPRSNSNTINAREFILCLWIFLTMENAALAKFTFDTLDDKHTGSNVISRTALYDLIILADGSNDADKKFKALLEKISLNSFNKDITFAEFENALRASPLLLRPVTQLQARIKDKIVGMSFWQARRPLKLEEEAVHNAVFKSFRRLSVSVREKRGSAGKDEAAEGTASAKKRGSVNIMTSAPPAAPEHQGHRRTSTSPARRKSGAAPDTAVASPTRRKSVVAAPENAAAEGAHSNSAKDPRGTPSAKGGSKKRRGSMQAVHAS